MQDWTDTREAYLRELGQIHPCAGMNCKREIWPDEGHDIEGDLYCDDCAEDILTDRAYGLAIAAFGPDADVSVHSFAENDLVHYRAFVPGAHLIRPPLGGSPAEALEHLIAALQHEIAEQQRRRAREA